MLSSLRNHVIHQFKVLPALKVQSIKCSFYWNLTSLQHPWAFKGIRLIPSNNARRLYSQQHNNPQDKEHQNFNIKIDNENYKDTDDNEKQQQEGKSTEEEEEVILSAMHCS